MKYIKLYEGYLNYENRKITREEVDDLELSDVRITTEERGKIEKLLMSINPNFKIKISGKLDISCGMNIRNPWTFQEVGITVTKLSDDWWLVSDDTLEMRKYYKCDQFEGLVEFLTSFKK